MNELELVWSEGTNSPAMPWFETVKGGSVITATPKGVKRIRCRSHGYMVKYYPLSHGMLKAVGEAADIAREEGVYYSVLLTDAYNNKMAFAAFKDKE